jgi:glycosyltransferase involved in cell wall biosynthesis
MRPAAAPGPDHAPEPSILIVVPSLAFGGAERQIGFLAPLLKEMEFPVEVVTFAGGGALQEPLDAAGIPVIVLERRGLLGAGSAIRLARHMARRQPRIVHAFLWSANFRARLAALASPGARVVISLRGFDDDLRWYHRAADRLLDRRIAAVVSNCAALAEDAATRGVGRHARHAVIFNGIPPAPEPPRTIAPGRAPTVGFIGRLERKKNPLALLPLAAELVRRRPGARIVVVGDGSLAPALRRGVEEAGLGAAFELAGATRDVRSCLGRLDVLVNTSLSEGCCNVILEAMQAGVPVVATAVGGNRETVRDGETGLLFPLADLEAGARAIDRLLADPPYARRLGEQGRVRVRTVFSVEGMARAYAELYRSLAA